MNAPIVPVQDPDVGGPATTERSGVDLRVMVSDRRSVPASLIDRVRAQVDARLPELSVGRRYTAEQLCGTESWAGLKRGECIRYGEALSFLARSSAFPLVSPGKNNRNHRLYVLR